MKLLSIDYGDKRIGLALSESGWIRPLAPLPNQSEEYVFRALQAIIQEYAVDKIILGLPVPLKANTNERLKITQTFGEKLQAQSTVKVELVRETFTTKLARSTAYTKSQKNNIDSRAACFILEQYLSQKAYQKKPK